VTKPGRKRVIPSTRAVTPLIALLLASGTAACGSDGGAGAQASGDGTCDGQSVNVGINNSGSDAPILIADEKGYFGEVGLEVELVEFKSGGQMVPAIGSGQIDVGAGSPGAGLYNAIGSGLDLRIVADKATMVPGHAYMPLMVRKDLVDSGQVQEVADLAGRTIAQSSEGSTASSTLGAILETAALGYEDVRLESLGFPEHVAALQNGSVDASLLVEPFATVAEEQGAAVRFFDPSEVYSGQQVAVLVYNGAFADEGVAATCFMEAYLRGARDYYKAVEPGSWTGENAEDLSQLIAQRIGLDVELYRQAVPHYADPNGAVQVESLKRDFGFFQQHGWIEADSDVNPAELVDPSFANAVVEKLGEIQTDAVG
jgi:NitT/TauT family transport system substrate-binding protein